MTCFIVLLPPGATYGSAVYCIPCAWEASLLLNSRQTRVVIVRVPLELAAFAIEALRGAIAHYAPSAAGSCEGTHTDL